MIDGRQPDMGPAIGCTLWLLAMAVAAIIVYARWCP